jgi:plastocyanin
MYIALALFSVWPLFLASSTAEAQMMRPMAFVAPRPVTTVRFFAPPTVVYHQPYYSPYYNPRMYYAPSYSYGGYASYAMPYSSGYGSYQMPNGNSYGSSYGGYPSSSYSRAQAEMNVGVYDNYFRPDSITVSVGTTVRWTNSGQHRHTITSDDGQWDSGELSPGTGYAHTFTAPGTYPYHCTVHANEMRGVVIVK